MPETANEKTIELLTNLRDKPGYVITPADIETLDLAIAALQSQASEEK